MNYLIDSIIILIFILYLIDGYRQGFIKNMLELIGFVLALFIAFITNYSISNFLASSLHLPLSLSKMIAFLAVWLLVNIVYSIILYFAYRIIPKEIKEAKANKFLGVLPAFFKAAIIALLLLVLLISMPLKESQILKNKVSQTYLARELLDSGSVLQKPYQTVFGKGIEDLINFFTLPPQSDKVVALNYQTNDLAVDENSENEMLRLVNQGRMSQGLSSLEMDNSLRQLARNHAKDMFLRGYFSHYTPEGLSPFDRMKNAGIVYIFAGENLALASDVNRAEDGLMDSSGHRENILNPNFNKIGIGVIDGDIYGRMFVQEFTN